MQKMALFLVLVMSLGAGYYLFVSAENILQDRVENNRIALEQYK